MLIDAIIVLALISALVRGREIGFVRQLLSTGGFFAGLFVGALLQPHVSRLVSGDVARTLVTLCCTVGLALVVMTIGEYIGVRIKTRVLLQPINKVDNVFGSGLSAVSLLVSVWLTAAIVYGLPLPSLRYALQNSHIISALDLTLPPAPSIIADLGHLINPNGFPQVFIGQEPVPNANQQLPDLGSLNGGVTLAKSSVVKLESEGCGGLVDGSGFVVGSNLVATNAHVVAGIRRPYVEDANGLHSGQVIWFDPDMDFAVLRVSNLAGSALNLANSTSPTGTAAAVLGYPGGGSFQVKAARILDRFDATGRNIYGRGTTTRSIYEIKADVIPGNSGGPLIDKNGTVIGVVFAESTTYQHVGYALTAGPLANAINQAVARNQTVSTGRCAE